MTLDETSRLQILTAPGGAFPLVDLDVDGVHLQMFDRDPRTLRDAFLGTAQHPERTAIVYGEQRWTFQEQWDEVARLAQALHDELGVRKGQRVGLAMRNYPEFVFTFWATQVLGAVTVPFNGWLRTRELADLIAEARPTVLVADGERIALLENEDLAASGVTAVVGVRCAETPGVVAYDELIARNSRSAGLPECEIDPEDPATILYTSGTTGKPKGAVHSHRNHSASLLNKLVRAMRIEPAADGGTPSIDLPAPSVKLVTFPFFHIAGLNTLYTAAYCGHTLVLMYKWDTAEALRLIEAERVSELAGAPFVVQTFLDASADTDHDLSSLRVLGMGGAATPAKVTAQVSERFGTQVSPRTGYGMTETTSGVVSISAADFATHPTSVGRALPTVEIALLDRDGNPVPQGGEGEIAVRGPQVVRGYDGVDDSDEFRDGWFLTGDLGRIDETGLIYIVGRIKDVVIRGGENIYCSEVESAMNGHPDVLESAALGAPHPSLGEELVALVRVQDGSAITADEVRSYLRDQLAAFKVPVRVGLTAMPLPRTPSGKIIKREIDPALLADLMPAPAGA